VGSDRKKGLGRGLGALISSNNKAFDDAPAAVKEAPAPAAPPVPQTLPDGTRLLLLDPTTLKPNPKQPRHVFREEALEELSESIRRDGVQEPVLVRQVGDEFELISGERRVRASIMADLREVPAICRNVSDQDMLKLGLIENIQREDLNAMEAAQAYQQLQEEFGWTQEQLATEVGKKRATVANMLRLLNLPEVVQEQVADGSITMGHARALLALPTASQQIAAARRIIKEGLSVRQAEKLAEGAKPGPPREAKKKDPNIAALEDSLRRSLGTKVALKSTSPEKGRIEIEYFSLDELERIIVVLRGGRA
jgi:ParB family chromosome partitioning protein